MTRQQVGVARNLRPVDVRFSSFMLFGSVLFAGLLAGCDLLGLGDEGNSTPRAKRKKKEPSQVALQFVGRKACAECHEEVVKSYAWSQHDRALEKPTEDTVAAPFAGGRLSGKKLVGIFIKKDGQPLIQSGKSYPVKWTIGHEPLQQYLVESDAGRVQAFPIAYDTRPAGDGGQRWFLLDERDVPAGDAMHWQGQSANWNVACANCHSTNVEKNYDVEKDAYETKFSELDVSCEACHGPASRHIELAKEHKDQAKWPASVMNFGFEVALADYSLRRWVRGVDDRVAHLEGNGDGPPEKTDELSTCAPCHSHRSDLGPAATGTITSSFDERYGLSLLSPELYFPDGQIKEEVYVYGSFLQSKKQTAGVVCSDCHNPHSTTLRKPVVDLCVSCHNPDVYEEQAHHLHPVEAEVTCVDCHMPERTSMGVDSRRDHRFGIPRPDLTLVNGTPNACESCHAHRPKWAAAMLDEAHGAERSESFATAFLSAEKREVQAPEKLAALVAAKDQPAIVRASALARWLELGRLSPELSRAMAAATTHEDVLLRRTAAEGAKRLSDEEQAKLLPRLYDDPVRSVRIAAALTSLSGPAPEKMSAPLKKALEEARASQLYQADQAEGLLALAAIEHRLGNPGKMSHYYELAAQRYPTNAIVFVDWAQALKEANQEDQAQTILTEGLKKHPHEPKLLHARGRWLVRQKKVPEAIPLLQQAFEKAPATLRRRYGYVYAVAVHDTGDWAEALAILRQLKGEYPEAEEVAQAITLYEEKRKK